jgi:hypothetical protein
VAHDLARRAKNTRVYCFGCMSVPLLDGSGLKREQRRLMVVENGQPKQVHLQQRQGAGDDGPQMPISEVTTHGHIY